MQLKYFIKNKPCVNFKFYTLNVKNVLKIVD